MMIGGCEELTEKEKETLRLVVRGYDAKSLARELGISVHTVNERLRHARRKLSVSSSREAARILVEQEGDGQETDTPDSLVSKQLGEATEAEDVEQDSGPDKTGFARQNRLILVIGGISIMSLFLTAIALVSASSHEAAPAPLPTATAAVTTAASPTAQPINPEIVQAGQAWLALVDDGEFKASWDASGKLFQQEVSSDGWAAISKEVRRSFGAVTSRNAISQHDVPAPPNGYIMLRFATSFANKPNTSETISLMREDGKWKVVGYYIG